MTRTGGLVDIGLVNKNPCIAALTAFLAACLLTSCPEKTPPHVPTTAVQPTTAAPSAAPTLDNAIIIHGQADGQAAVTAVQVTSLSAQLKKVHGEAVSAVQELDRMRKAKFAVEEDLVTFYNRLIEQEKAMKAMTLQVVDVETSLAKERELRQQEGLKLRETEGLLRAKEQEASMLRVQLTQANANSVAAEAAVQAIGKAEIKLREDVGRLAGESAFKTKLLIGAGILLLLLTAGFLLLLKFRTLLPF